MGGGGSVLGVGSDFGGSLRVPAHFTGICTIKPTAERVSNKGQIHTQEQTGQVRCMYINLKIAYRYIKFDFITSCFIICLTIKNSRYIYLCLTNIQF